MGIPKERLTCLAVFVTQKQNKAKQNKEGKNNAVLAGGVNVSLGKNPAAG